jgi:glycerophosphoryl diester phosphodiesterase
VESAEHFQDALDRAVLDEGSVLDVEIGVALAHPERVAEALREEVEVMAWTVDDEAQASSALELGISRITTNEVERLMTWRVGLV